VINEINSKIAEVYRRRRSDSEERAYLTREKTLKRHPILAKIEDELAAANAKIASEIISDGIERDSSPEKEQLLGKRLEYLHNNGIPEDYGRPVPVCKKCSDTGIDPEDPDKRCVCYKNIVRPFLFEFAGFPYLSKYTFENFDSDLFSKKITNNKSPKRQIEAIKDMIDKFVDTFDDPDTRSLFFIGSPGTGKTFMAGCAANLLIEKQRTVLYLSAPDMYDRINEYRIASGAFSLDRERVEKASREYDHILNCDLLIIDDLGTETSTPERQPELLAILNRRAGTSRKMLITTNMEMKNLMDFYDERLLSRIYGNFTVLKFYGEDLRLQGRIRG
jgi:DNA replication protein DnaC